MFSKATGNSKHAIGNKVKIIWFVNIIWFIIMTKIVGISLQGVFLCFALCNQKEHSMKK